MGDWQHSILGCFDNMGICIITYFVPCYTFGKNSEQVGESCILCGLLYFIPVVDLVALVSVRGKVRQQSNIPGSCFGDLLAVIFCHPCALAQEAQELQGSGGYGMVRE
ncbi:hypothetical protein SNE40_012472 [Patella caerulea]|uniref:Uncharacterized protein n=1 Tax=Patella caerulea TaxID=87958 RepID=A0AAN8JLS5_PATCE